MNNKTEQKKEYVKPVMEIIGFARECALLQGSDNPPVEPDTDQASFDALEY
ncbi:hypothetical protein [Fibrobacter sp. UWB12]|uniref:hypothetical protein n=1 Tax=Fibrobacter sp. UWB12 TaxID=1896203 RepID=UPI00091A6E93|nr:hypothetical protein [Fibrobacter sp. UWB12]SHL01530.1 hypothetical protein SAMN05720759_11312 [Fibrobacter sp. UWB12]